MSAKVYCTFSVQCQSSRTQRQELPHWLRPRPHHCPHPLASEDSMLLKWTLGSTMLINIFSYGDYLHKLLA